MNNILWVLLLFTTVLKAQNAAPCYADSFNILNTKIRDGKIDKAKAKDLALFYLKEVKKYYIAKNLTTSQFWQFPLQGYNKLAIGGTNGNGYQPAGYNYFDGNKHLGHPAHDIFIQDKNQDLLDDKTLKEVPVVAISAGIVVAMETVWDTSSRLRGGKYIWIYDPTNELLFYYAHNNTVKVHVCDFVKPSEIIATVGRSGKNAFKKRSPTHLHLMVLRTDKDHFLEPTNPYQRLLTAKTSH